MNEKMKTLARIMVYVPVPQKIALERFKKKGLPFSHVVSEALRIHFQEVAEGRRPVVDYNSAINEMIGGMDETNL